MIEIPNMVMIGGNSRNAGKTTLAGKIIKKLAVNHQVIALKVTSIRPGESEMHGDHSAELNSGFSILEELNSDSHKDTSAMLRAGASKVFYIRTIDECMEPAILQFLSDYNINQPIVCESRSLRRIVNPGLFIMMIRNNAEGKPKDIFSYISHADHVFTFDNDILEVKSFVDKLNFLNGKFLTNNA